jgi:molybdopterin synthase catalytic subunit
VTDSTTTSHVDGGKRVTTAILDTALSVDDAMGHVAHPRAGGVVTFVGVVRDHDGGRSVTALEYSAHPSAAAILADLAAEIAGRDGVVAVSAVHRTGALEIGDLAVVLAVSAEHRGQAFDACRELIDRLKAIVPIWKNQSFGDGSSEWVGTP